MKLLQVEHEGLAFCGRVSEHFTRVGLVDRMYLDFEKSFDKCPDLGFSKIPKMSCIP